VEGTFSFFIFLFFYFSEQQVNLCAGGSEIENIKLINMILCIMLCIYASIHINIYMHLCMSIYLRFRMAVEGGNSNSSEDDSPSDDASCGDPERGTTFGFLPLLAPAAFLSFTGSLVCDDVADDDAAVEVVEEELPPS
jgi:hypothetical protein